MGKNKRGVQDGTGSYKESNMYKTGHKGKKQGHQQVLFFPILFTAKKTGHKGKKQGHQQGNC
jgi:hypothetical protein